MIVGFRPIPACCASRRPAGERHAAQAGARRACRLRDGGRPRRGREHAGGVRQRHELGGAGRAPGEEKDIDGAVPDRRKTRAAVPNDPYYAAGPAVNQRTSRRPRGGPVVPARAPHQRGALGHQCRSGLGRAGGHVHAGGGGGARHRRALRSPGSGGQAAERLRHGRRGQDRPGPTARHLPDLKKDGDGRDADASDLGDGITAAEANDSAGLFYQCTTLDSTTGKYRRGVQLWHGTQVSGIIGAATDNGIGMASVGRERARAAGARAGQVRRLGLGHHRRHELGRGRHGPWRSGQSGAREGAEPQLGRQRNRSPAYQSTVSALNAGAWRGRRRLGWQRQRPWASEPANCAGVIGVAGVRHEGDKVGYSDIGPELSIAAPAGNCVGPAATVLASTHPHHRQQRQLQCPCIQRALPVRSTPMRTTPPSAPASPRRWSPGTAALMLSVKPDLTPAQIRQLLMSTARAFPPTSARPDCRARRHCAEPVQLHHHHLRCRHARMPAAAARRERRQWWRRWWAPAVAAAAAPRPRLAGRAGAGRGRAGRAALAPRRRGAVSLTRAALRTRLAAIALAALAASLRRRRPSRGRSVNGLIVGCATAPMRRARPQERLDRAARGWLNARSRATWDRVRAPPGFRRPPAARGGAAPRAAPGRIARGQWVVPNERERRLTVPQDPLFAASVSSSGQWWLFPAGGGNANDIEERAAASPGVQTAWQVGTGTAAPVVAILDTGITSRHPDLDGAVLPGRDFVSDRRVRQRRRRLGRRRQRPGRLGQRGRPQRQRAPVRRLRGGRQLLARHGDRRPAGGRHRQLAGRRRRSTAAACCRCAWSASAAPTWPTSWPACAGRRPAGLRRRPRPDSTRTGACAQHQLRRQRRVQRRLPGCDRRARGQGVVVVAAAGNEHGAVTRPANCRGVIGVARAESRRFQVQLFELRHRRGDRPPSAATRACRQLGHLALGRRLLTLGNAGTTGRAAASTTATREAGTSFAVAGRRGGAHG